jgi:hypothetical protein
MDSEPYVGTIDAQREQAVVLMPVIRRIWREL